MAANWDGRSLVTDLTPMEPSVESDTTYGGNRVAKVSWLKVGEKFVITAGGREIDVIVSDTRRGAAHISVDGDSDVEIRKENARI